MFESLRETMVYTVFACELAVVWPVGGCLN